MNWMRILNSISQVADIVSQTVKTVEVVRGPGRGADKKAAAMASIKVLLGFTDPSTLSQEKAKKVENLISALIDLSVEEDLS